jgi:hypothetical protein
MTNKTTRKKTWPPANFESQGQYLSDASDADVRKTFVQIARSCLDLKTSSRLYQDLCYPDDKRKQQAVLAAAQHGCGLTMAGVIRCGGCLDEMIMGPYAGRSDAFTRVEVMAKRHGAWAGHDAEFEEGEIVIVGTDVPRDAPRRTQIIAQWGTPGHMFLVEQMDNQTRKLVSIDGGREPIHRTDRTFKKDDQGRLWVTGFTKRRVWGVVRVAKLKFDPLVEWCMPKGPNYPGLA